MTQTQIQLEDWPVVSEAHPKCHICGAWLFSDGKCSNQWCSRNDPPSLPPRLTERQQEAVRLLRTARERGFREHYGTFATSCGGRCAVGTLGFDSVCVGAKAVQAEIENIDKKYGVNTTLLSWNFERNRWTFAEAADALEREPERYFQQGG